MVVDAKTVVIVLIGAAVFAAVQGLIGVASVATQKKKVNRRLTVAGKVEGISALVVELRKQRGLSASGARAERLRWLSDLIVASGLPYDQKKWLLYVVAAAVLGALLVGLLTKNPLGFAAGAVVGGLLLPLGVLKFQANRRAKALGQQLPQALEVIVRSLEAGHPVPAAVALLVVGWRRRVGDPAYRSWNAYATGLVLALVPSLLRAVTDAGEVRPFLLGVAALAVVAVGVTRRLQAPLLIGGAVLAIDAVVQLAPYLSAVYDAVPRWVTIGLIGLLLVVAGATYEQRVRDLRRVGDRVARLG